MQVLISDFNQEAKIAVLLLFLFPDIPKFDIVPAFTKGFKMVTGKYPDGGC
jgi:hypothetical protein